MSVPHEREFFLSVFSAIQLQVGPTECKATLLTHVVYNFHSDYLFKPVTRLLSFLSREPTVGPIENTVTDSLVDCPDFAYMRAINTARKFDAVLSVQDIHPSDIASLIQYIANLEVSLRRESVKCE